MSLRAPILHIEDDPLDVENLARAFKRLEVGTPIRTARNGKEALALLRCEGSEGAFWPALILLDLGMPIMGGLEFLEAQKSDPGLRAISTVVLSGSNRDGERRRAYELGAAGYVVKPIRFDDFVAAMGLLDRYWALCEPP